MALRYEARFKVKHLDSNYCFITLESPSGLKELDQFLSLELRTPEDQILAKELVELLNRTIGSVLLGKGNVVECSIK